jgi:hypothetical protein
MDKHDRFDKSFLNDCFLVACSNATNLDIIKYLVNKLKVCINHVDGWRNSGLLYACYYNPQLDVIRYLVEELKLNINYCNKDIDNGFMFACSGHFYPNLQVIRYFVEELKININHINKWGANGFNYACNDNFRHLNDHVHMCAHNDVIRYLNDHTIIKHIVSNCLLDECHDELDELLAEFAMIIKNLVNTTTNHDRFNELLIEGINTFEKHNIYDCDLMKIINPFNAKFKDFVKNFNKISDGVKMHYANPVMTQESTQS